MPHKSDSQPCKGTSLSLSEAAYGSMGPHAYVWTYSFSSNEHLTCFTTLLYMEVHFYRVVGQGLVTGH